MRQRQERKRERLVFVLFIVLSIVFHVFLLIAVASAPRNKMSNRPKPQQMAVMRVAPVNLPPEKPPPTPEAPPSPDPIRHRDPIAQRPLATPRPAIPTPTPLPTPTPTPVASASPSPGPSAMPTPLPSTTPSPSAMPTPRPTQLAQLPPEEQGAKDFAAKYLRDAGLDVPDKLPYGYKSWQDYAKTLTPEWEAEARKMGMLPENLQGPDGGQGTSGSPNPNASPANPNATPDPGASGSADGSGDGSGGFSLFGPLPGIDPDKYSLTTDKFDKTGLRPEDLTDDPDKLNHDLDKLNHGLNTNTNFDNVSPSAPKIDYQITDTGLTFNYDGQDFRVVLPEESNRSKPDQRVNVRYSKNRTGETTFELDWKPAWVTSMNAVVEAIVERYNEIKRGG